MNYTKGLELKHVNASINGRQIIRDISFSTQPGETIAIIGPNGAGKSTILRLICGLHGASSGDIFFMGKNISGNNPRQNLLMGISYCPQGHRVFSTMTVHENLIAAGYILEKKVVNNRIEELIELFPDLKTKMNQQAGAISGGECQMLSLARSLMTSPNLLLLDEPTLGLAPHLIKKIFSHIRKVKTSSTRSIIIVEHKIREVLDITDRVYGIKNGEILFHYNSSEILSNKKLLSNLFLDKVN